MSPPRRNKLLVTHQLIGSNTNTKYTSLRAVSIITLWQAVVDVPPSLQRVVEFLLRVVDISQLYNVYYNAL